MYMWVFLNLIFYLIRKTFIFFTTVFVSLRMNLNKEASWLYAQLFVNDETLKNVNDEEWNLAIEMFPSERQITLQKQNLFLFYNILGGHMSFLWGHWYPCFRLLVTSALGYKARVDSLVHFLACMLFLRFTSHATPANLLTANMVACRIPYMCQQR